MLYSCSLEHTSVSSRDYRTYEHNANSINCICTIMLLEVDEQALKHIFCLFFCQESKKEYWSF